MTKSEAFRIALPPRNFYCKVGGLPSNERKRLPVMRLNKTYILLSMAALWLSACAGLPALPAPQPSDIADQLSASEIPTTQVVVEENMPTPSTEELLALGRDAANRGAWQEAIAYYDQVLAQDAASAQAHHLRGNAYRALGDFDQAIIDYDTALALDSSYAEAYNSRALAYTETGGYAQALADFGRAVELEPGFAIAYRNRAELHITEGRYEAAVLDLQIYLNLVPNAPDRALLEARISELQGEAPQVADESGLIFFDDFSDPNSGWYSNGAPEPNLLEYDKEGYRILVALPNDAIWALPGRLFTNVSIEVTASKEGGDDDNFFGIMCRVQGTTHSANFYLLMISSDGYYGIAKRVEGGDLALIAQDKMQFSQAINLGATANKIRAECVEDRLTLYANDVMLVEVFDEDLNTGQIGLMAGTFDVPGTNILFDDLAVYTLEPNE